MKDGMLQLSDGEIEMVLTALGCALDVWNAEAKKADNPLIKAMAEGQIKSWNTLKEKVEKQYEG